VRLIYGHLSISLLLAETPDPSNTHRAARASPSYNLLQTNWNWLSLPRCSRDGETPALPPGPTAELGAITDTAVEATRDQLWAEADKLLNKRGVKKPNDTVVDRVLENFERTVPYGEGASLAEIITAGWRYLRNRRGLPQETDDTMFDLVNELMLKSIEVSEYQLRVNRRAEQP
jgi:hypothetical protein